MCTTFALMFISFSHVHQHNRVYDTFGKNEYICMSIHPSVEIKVKVLFESHPEHSLRVYSHSFHQYQVILLLDKGSGLFKVCPMWAPGLRE